jgi:hypothetical protein
MATYGRNFGFRVTLYWSLSENKEGVGRFFIPLALPYFIRWYTADYGRLMTSPDSTAYYYLPDNYMPM